MQYLNIVLRCLVALIPILGSAFERFLGRKVKGYLLSCKELSDYYEKANKDGEITKEELDEIMLYLSALMHKAKEDGLL